MPNRNELPGLLEERYKITLTDQERMLLTTGTDLLTLHQKQKVFLLRAALTPLQCPACSNLVCQRSCMTADPDSDASIPDDSYKCPHCGALLTWHLHVFGGDQSFTLSPGQTVTITKPEGR